MGVDVGNLWLHVSDDEDAERVRERAAQCIETRALAAGYEPAHSDPDAVRSFVIGPRGRWLLIGDSADCLDLERGEEPASLDLPRALSEIGSVIALASSDGCTHMLRLFENGALQDTFQSGVFPFYPFESEAAAADHAGDPERWLPLLAAEHGTADLRALFTQSIMGKAGDAPDHRFLPRMAELFGMPRDLIEVGYTWNPDGVPVSYRQYVQRVPEQALPGPRPDLSSFYELHFALPGKPGRGRWETPFWPE